MENNCGCGHCGCGDDNPPAGGEKTPEEKVKELKKEIEGLGYKVEETADGEIKVSQ